MSVEAAATIGSTVIRYLSPTISPYYAVASSGVVSILLTCEGIPSWIVWLSVALPIYSVLVFSVWLSQKSTAVAGADDGVDQLKIARSIAISGALISLVLAVRDNTFVQKQYYIGIIWFACIAQMAERS